MKKGILYFNLGTKCLPRIIVSLHSLMKHYNGEVTVISAGDESNKSCNKIFEQNGINIIKAEYDQKLEGRNSVFLKKAAINLHTPYDISVFLDADTLVRGDISELFDLAEQYGFVVPQFTNWTTNTRAIIKRINGWKKVYPELIDKALKYGPALNCGVFAFKKDTQFMLEWSDKIIPGRANFIPDETGMQVILQNYPHHVCNQKYNVSCKYSKPKDTDTRIIHFHGKKHCRLNTDNEILYCGDLWIDEYNECIKDNYLGIKNLKNDDRMLKRYLNTGKVKKKEILERTITIVTAVNPPYLDKLRTVLPTWQLKKQLKDAKLLVLHNGFKNPEKDLAFIKEISGRDTRLVNWEMEGAESNRELMLSAFVLGAPKYVDTNYWLKLDADAFFCDGRDFLLDHFFDYDLAGHKWRYSKPGSWLCILDDWAEANDIDGDVYLTENQREQASVSKRYGHKRIASFVCLHRTEFTREVLELFDGRLPVPSHDTLYWYLAERLPDRKWCWHHFKKLGVSNQTNYDKLKSIVNEVLSKHKT